MRRDGIGKLVLNGLFIGLMAIGVVAMTGSAGYAQGRNNNGRSWDGYPNWGGSFDLRQTALNAGYNEGTSAGAKDRGRGARSYNDLSVYRSATKDYSSRLGDRNLYQRYFRIAFEHGYNDGVGIVGGNNGNWNNNNGGWNNNGNNNGNNNNGSWNNNTGWNNNGNWDRNNRRGRNWDRYDNYGGSFQLRQTALNAGYNEGIKQGRKDRSRGPRNLNEFSSYRDAKTDYNSRNGDFGMHQRYYRQGFENGYYDGLNGY